MMLFLLIFLFILDLFLLFAPPAVFEAIYKWIRGGKIKSDG